MQAFDAPEPLASQGWQRPLAQQAHRPAGLGSTVVI